MDTEDLVGVLIIVVIVVLAFVVLAFAVIGLDSWGSGSDIDTTPPIYHINNPDGGVDVNRFTDGDVVCYVANTHDGVALDCLGGE